MERKWVTKTPWALETVNVEQLQQFSLDNTGYILVHAYTCTKYKNALCRQLLVENTPIAVVNWC